jgi:hypothetical protein
MRLRKYVVTVWAATYDCDELPRHDVFLRELADEIEEGRAELVRVTSVETQQAQDDPDYFPHVGQNLAPWLRRSWN